MHWCYRGSATDGRKKQKSVDNSLEESKFKTKAMLDISKTTNNDTTVYYVYFVLKDIH